MFISKKKYNEIIAEKEAFGKIAFDVHEQNKELLQEMREIQDLNWQINERCKKVYRDYCDASEKVRELTELVEALTRQRDSYFKLLEERGAIYESDTYAEQEVE